MGAFAVGVVVLIFGSLLANNTSQQMSIEQLQKKDQENQQEIQQLSKYKPQGKVTIDGITVQNLQK